jgi:two-component system CheB/CheR fusion protein
VERTVQDDKGETYLLRIRPYKTPDNRIDGAVIALFDLDPAKK